MPKEKKEIKDKIPALTECNEGRTYQFACGLTAHQQEFPPRHKSRVSLISCRLK